MPRFRRKSRARPWRGFESYPVFLTEEEMEQFYLGFCNSTIWPLFHYFTSLRGVPAAVLGAVQTDQSIVRGRLGVGASARRRGLGARLSLDVVAAPAQGAATRVVGRLLSAYSVSIFRGVSPAAGRMAPGNFGRAAWAPTWSAFIPTSTRTISCSAPCAFSATKIR